MLNIYLIYSINPWNWVHMTFWMLIMSIEAGIIYKMYRKHVNNLKPFHLNMMILIGLMRNNLKGII